MELVKGRKMWCLAFTAAELTQVEGNKVGKPELTASIMIFVSSRVELRKVLLNGLIVEREKVVG